MNILITGASGFIGQNLTKALIDSEHSITACIFKTELPFNVKILKFDFAKMLKITDWLPYLINIDVVINCVGVIAENKKHSFELMHAKSPIALFKACEKTHVKRIIHISALGADNSAIATYHKTKLQADNYLRSSPLDWFILRPSLVYAKGGKSYQMFKRLSNLPVIPLIGTGQQLIQPVSLEKIIQVLVKCITTKQINKTIDVVGEQIISYQQWMGQLRVKKSKARYVCVPLFLMKFMAILVKPLNLQLFSYDNITMLEQSNVGDFSQLKSFMENKK